MAKVAVVIAAFNEEKQIAKVVKAVRDKGWKNVVVVDDGSTDSTQEKAFSAGATVLRHILNRGQGAALKTGFDYAVREGFDVAVTFDADGQHDASEIKDIVTPVASGKAEIALGSRFMKAGSNVPFMRKMALKGGAFLMRLMYGVSLTDSHNGFRALSRKALGKMELRSDRMEHASEIVSEIGRRRLSYIEVPVTITYTDYSIKNSKQGSLPALKILWKMIIQKVVR